MHRNIPKLLVFLGLIFSDIKMLFMDYRSCYMICSHKGKFLSLFLTKFETSGKLQLSFEIQNFGTLHSSDIFEAFRARPIVPSFLPLRLFCYGVGAAQVTSTNTICPKKILAAALQSVENTKCEPFLSQLVLCFCF